MSDGLPQSLEQVRQKLQQLTTSLQSLHYRIGTTPDDLPPLQTIGSSLKVIFTQLASLTEALLTGTDLARTVVHPRAVAFPVATHEPLLTTLIRTRGLPETEAWQEEALAAGQLADKSLPPITYAQGQEEEGVEEKTTLDVYTASEWLAAQRERRLWTGFYTRRETDAAFEIDRDDVDDIRRGRQEDQERARTEMGLMLRFARRGA